MEARNRGSGNRRALIGFLAAVGAATILGGVALGVYRAVAKPAMPVTVTFERAIAVQGRSVLDGALAAKIANTSGRYLALRVVAENKTLQQATTQTIELPPERNATNPVEFGWQQGWRFASGETLTLTHEDYQSLRVTVP